MQISGLSLPQMKYAKEYRSTKKRPVKTGRREDLYRFISDVQITQIRDYGLGESVLMLSEIAGEIALRRILFLQNCILHFDVRKKGGYLVLILKW
jgi:hypothetical protein